MQYAELTFHCGDIKCSSELDAPDYPDMAYGLQVYQVKATTWALIHWYASSASKISLFIIFLQFS